MASEELQSGVNPQSEAPAPVPAITLPQYPEMIITAIEALNDPNGSNKSAISKQIESTYGNLPPAHSTLLTHHLNRMKSAGQLLFLKNNYLKPDPNAPPRRGRGRPPKAKTSVPAGVVPSSPRPRGRPPKSNDPDAPPKPPKVAAPLSGKKRGRPPKAATSDVASPAAVKMQSAAAGGGGGTPRGRGRPPKVKPAVAAAPVGA